MQQVNDGTGDELRRVMRSMAATVTVVSTSQDARRYGMVATAVLALSLEPATLAVGVNRSASIHDPLVRRGVFCVNVLSRDDEHVGREFAALSGEERFSAGVWRRGRNGVFASVPYLESAQAAIFCRVKSQVEAGTHTLLIGEVEEVLEGTPRTPLLYCDGGFGTFVPAARQVTEKPAAVPDRQWCPDARTRRRA